MIDRTMIDRYLEDVGAYLHVRRAHRKRVLAEIEGHLHDAVDALVAEGVPLQQATRRAIAEVGQPRDLAMQFSPRPVPTRAVRGWRRWAPIALPSVVLTVGVVISVGNLLLLGDGSTLGVQIALRRSLLYTAVAGALTAATYVALRNGDRDRTWRSAAWALAALAGVFVAMNASM